MGTTPLITENQVEAASPSQVVLEEKIDPPEALDVNKIKSEGISTKDIVTLYFKDNPTLVKIASCESTFRQFDANGNVIRGKVNSKDIGVMQINERYHLKESKALGFDIYTLEGNMAYAKYLYEKKGSQPWKASKACWKK